MQITAARNTVDARNVTTSEHLVILVRSPVI